MQFQRDSPDVLPTRTYNLPTRAQSKPKCDCKKKQWQSRNYLTEEEETGQRNFLRNHVKGCILVFYLYLLQQHDSDQNSLQFELKCEIVYTTVSWFTGIYSRESLGNQNRPVVLLLVLNIHQDLQLCQVIFLKIFNYFRFTYFEVPSSDNFCYS